MYSSPSRTPKVLGLNPRRSMISEEQNFLQMNSRKQKSENLMQASHSIKIKKQLIVTRKTYKKQIIKLSRKCTKLF